jgi:hypothetical protein
MPFTGPALPVPAAGKVEVRSHFKVDTWPPFRSVDAGLHTMTVYRHGFDTKPGDALSLTWTFVHDKKRRPRTAEATEDMIRALSGFLQPAYGDRIEVMGGGMQDHQSTREQQMALVINSHRGTYERFVAAGTTDDAARALATSLSPKVLWYVAVMAFAVPPDDASEPQGTGLSVAAIQRDVQLASVAILEAIPGPCFPVRLNVGGHRRWELRPRRKLHDRWCVEVPMRFEGGWEPELLANDFFIAYATRARFITFNGEYTIGASAYLMRGILRDDAEAAAATSIEDWIEDQDSRRWVLNHPVECSNARQFLWLSAGLACVAPAALLFNMSGMITCSALLARLQLLWNGTGDVDTNPLTYNNVAMLVHGSRKDALVAPIPPMGRSDTEWDPDWREKLLLPASRMGLRPSPAFFPDMPMVVTKELMLGPFNKDKHGPLVRRFGVPLDEYHRMDVDAAVALAPDDVKQAALDVRAALLDRDASHPILAREVNLLDSVYSIWQIVLAACYRCNGMLPLRVSLFTAGHLGGIDYSNPTPRPPPVAFEQQSTVSVASGDDER